MQEYRFKAFTSPARYGVQVANSAIAAANGSRRPVAAVSAGGLFGSGGLRWAQSKSAIENLPWAYYQEMDYSPSRDSDGKPLIGPRDAAFASWGFAVCSLLLAWMEWVNPTQQPFTGKFAWLFSLSVEFLGSRGPFVALCGFTLLLFAFGILSWLGSKRVARSEAGNLPLR